MALDLSGSVSGFDWKSVMFQLVNVGFAPQRIARPGKLEVWENLDLGLTEEGTATASIQVEDTQAGSIREYVDES